MECSNCKSQNEESKKYCGDCGTYLLSNIINDTDLKNRIESILEKKLKDRQVVEIEITENIVSKLASWAKLFAYFIGIPLAIILFILGFLGYNSYSGFTKLISNTENKIKPQIEQAKLKVDSINKEADILKLNFEKYKRLDKEVEELTKTVNVIAEKFKIKGISGDRKSKIESSLNLFQNYLQNLGYSPKGNDVNVSIESAATMNGTACYYDGKSNTMHIDSSYSDDPDLFFREYMHRVLYSKIDLTNSDFYDKNKFWFYSIESGLANYFTCSFNDTPIFASTSAKKGNDFEINFSKKLMFKKPVDMNDAMYTVSNMWGSAFWEIRLLLGKDIADKLFYTSWKAISLNTYDNNNPNEFISILLNTDQIIEEGKNKIGIKEIFDKRGLK